MNTNAILAKQYRGETLNDQEVVFLIAQVSDLVDRMDAIARKNIEKFYQTSA